MALPTRPTPTLEKYVFPNDLLSDDNSRRYYLQIQMVHYDSSYATGNNLYTIPKGGIYLPMPRKINDITVANWEQVSATQYAAQLGSMVPGMQTISNIAGPVMDIIGGVTGITINPFLWLLFKGMNFKEHQFTWTLTANTEQESVTINNIINYLKVNMLPLADPGSPFMGYPDIALLKFYPNDIFNEFRFKPAAISNIVVDYTGSGVPSFFKNGAPTVVNLTVTFKEIEIWTYNNYYVGAPAQQSPPRTRTGGTPAT